jgi:hypothetical protein
VLAYIKLGRNAGQTATLSDPHGLVICDRTAPLSNHINNMGYAFLLELGHQLCARQGSADYLCFIHSCIYSFIFDAFLASSLGTTFARGKAPQITCVFNLSIRSFVHVIVKQ